MRIVGLVLRIFSFAFNALIVVFLLASSVLAWTSGSTLEIGVLPWTGDALIRWTFISGVTGAILGLLALRRLVPALFLVWNVAVFLMLAKGFFFSSYGFGLGGGNFTNALYITFAAFVAGVGSWFQMRPAQAEVRRRQAALA